LSFLALKKLSKSYSCPCTFGAFLKELQEKFYLRD
jgi:hypothetical protein